MKQFIRTVLIFLIGIITATFGAYLYFNVLSTPKEVRELDPVNLTGEEEAFITAISGEVYIMRDDSIIEAEIGNPLYAGDIIKVVDESFCQVQFSTVASARIRSNTIVQIKKLLNIDKSPDISTEILTGSMLYRVNKLSEGEKLEVKSEEKLYSVQGTTFLVDRSSDGTYLIVEEGQVAVSVEASGEQLAIAQEGSRFAKGVLGPLTESDAKILEEGENLSVLDFSTQSELVKTGVITIPGDAQIYVNGLLSGKGSYIGLFPSGEDLTFLVRKRGYKDKVLSIKAVSDLEYRVVLDPEMTEESILEKERELSAESGNMAKLQRDLQSRTERLREVEALILELKELNSELQSQVSLNENRIRKLTSDIQTLEQQKTDLTTEVSELERKLNESTAREGKLRELIRQIQEISTTNENQSEE